MISIPDLEKYKENHFVVTSKPMSPVLKEAGELFGIKIYECNFLESNKAYLIHEDMSKFKWEWIDGRAEIQYVCTSAARTSNCSPH